MSTMHLITADIDPAQRRELHINALTTEIKQPLERLLPALGLRSPLMRAGVWRVVDVPACPQCGTSAPMDRSDLVPWVFRSQRVVCDGGCEFGPRELLDLFCKTDQELDAALAKVQAGRPALRRYYVLELRLSEAVGDTPAKWRRVVGDDVIATLARLELAGDAVVRGVVIDCADMMVAQSIARSDREIPWHERVPIDFRGRLLDIAWHGAPLSFAERQLQRRRRLAG
jgi:hypothetical protein